MKQTDTGRRHFLLGAAYIAPAILTLSVTPSFASTGSTASEVDNHRRRDQGERDHRHRSVQRPGQ